MITAGDEFLEEDEERVLLPLLFTTGELEFLVELYVLFVELLLGVVLELLETLLLLSELLLIASELLELSLREMLLLLLLLLEYCLEVLTRASS